MGLKIIITTEENGVKILTTFDDLQKADLRYRNLTTEKENGRYKGILTIEIAIIK